MIDQKIEKAAQEYDQRLVNEYDQDLPELSLCDLKFDCQNAFIAGAQVALQNQWVSVEDALPEEETIVTAHSPNGRIDVLIYHDREFVDELGQAHCIDYFIPIPQLNPEKEEKL